MSGKLPILYSFRRCPYAMRARLALSAAGQACELREIVLRDKAPEFLETSPKGTVPVLVLPNQRVIEQSFEIMQWALSRHDPENWLTPDTGKLNEMLALIDEADHSFKQQLDRYKYASRGTPEDGLEARRLGSEYLTKLDQMLAGQPYLYGDRIKLADMAILPFIRQFANVDRDWFDNQPWPQLIRWLDGLLVSERFTGIMKKYKKWSAGDEPLLFQSH